MQLVGELRCAPLRRVGEHDRRSTGHESARHRTADPGRGTRDDRHLAFEVGVGRHRRAYDEARATASGARTLAGREPPAQARSHWSAAMNGQTAATSTPNFSRSPSTDEVLILPTAAAYEHPEKAVRTAEAWFAGLGARARGLMVLGRTDAEDPANAAVVRIGVVRLPGRRIRRCTCARCSRTRPRGQALIDAWRDGAVVAGSSAGAMVLTDPMVDPHGRRAHGRARHDREPGGHPSLRTTRTQRRSTVRWPSQLPGSRSSACPSAPLSSATPTALEAVRSRRGRGLRERAGRRDGCAARRCQSASVITSQPL